MATEPRKLPQSHEAERIVLEGVLASNGVLADLSDAVGSEDFFVEAHSCIFAAMVSLGSRSAAIDVVTLEHELLKLGKLTEAGGRKYLDTLDCGAAWQDFAHHAKIVRETAVLRRLIETAHSIARRAYVQEGQVGELLDAAQSEIYAVASTGAAARTPQPIRSSILRVMQSLEKRYEAQQAVTGLSSGLEALDELTAGFQKGDLIIIAGRTSIGKTAVVMNIAAFVALDLKLPVAVFSLEMTEDALSERILSSDARVNGTRVRTGKLLDHDWPKLSAATNRLMKAPLFIDGTGNADEMTVRDVRARSRRLKAKHPGLALIVVDYLQLMRGSRRQRDGNREQEISEISRGLKAMARELDVPVIALAQLNRNLEKREGKRPMLSDLRESGSIEQDADLVCLLYRDDLYNKDSQDKGVAEIIVAKQRRGPTGTARVAFLKDYTRFENLAGDWG